jgi:hypothetical protein
VESTPEQKPVAREEDYRYTEPVSLRVTVWIETELPRKDFYPDWFRHHIETICSDVDYAVKTRLHCHSTVRSVTCDEVVTYENARDLRVVRHEPRDEAG